MADGPDLKVKRPIVFISHAASDALIAELVKGEIDRVFAKAIDVFATSVPGSLPPGTDWLEQVRKHLDAASVVLVLITPTSINRPWVWFEVGASWNKMVSKNGLILPLVVAEVDKGELPEPLSRLQAKSLAVAAEIKEVFEHLIAQFGIGDIKALKPGPLKDKIPKYSKVKISDADASSRTFYAGPYEGYSDEELKEVIDQEIFQFAEHHEYGHSDGDARHLFTGELMHFRNFDRQHQLPAGTAKRLVVDVAARYDLKPVLLTENTVRFARSKPRSWP